MNYSSAKTVSKKQPAKAKKVSSSGGGKGGSLPPKYRGIKGA